jgi:energy-coupling factor transporter ATP-binding protein EcfA2
VDGFEQQLVRPDMAMADGALVLLGEPGSGKTTTFSSLTGAGPATPPPEPGESGTVWVTGADLTNAEAFDDAVGQYLAALPDPANAAVPAELLTIVLDQLDESGDLPRLPRRFQRALTGKDTRSLRVLVACRTADYPDQLTRVLQQALGSCAAADLAPLTRSGVAMLVDGTGIDAPPFLNVVVDAGVGMLASVPLTLKILLTAYSNDRTSLNRGTRQLFERGVATLADEHDRNRSQPPFTATSVQQRVVIASRIAARMMLAGRRTIWTGVHALAHPRDLTEGMLSGGTEDHLGSFDVTPAAVGETLRTGLFSHSGTGRIAFGHSSLAAFLAARYLVSRLEHDHESVHRRLSDVFLVAAPDEDTASVPVHLRETAAWLVTHAPQHYRWLAEADPESLAAYGSYISDHPSRKLIAAGLLARSNDQNLWMVLGEVTRMAHLPEDDLKGPEF